MSIEECKAATCAANPEAIASLLDGNGDLAKALLVPEKDTQALIDLARYQHQVLSEIAETIDSSRDLLNCSARRLHEMRVHYCARRQKRAVVVSVGSYGPFEAGDAEAWRSAFDALAAENEA